MLKNLDKYNIILASGSPRRKELLQQLGLDFRVLAPDVDESYPETLGMTAIPTYLSELKAEAMMNTVDKDALVIAADTIVWQKNQQFGKPKNAEQAAQMLRELSGTQHQVITGVTIQSQEKKRSFHAVTEVWFEELTESEIQHYIDKYKPFDKAGAYGIQEWIGFIGIYRIDGSFYNVMGLPVHKLYRMLKEF